MELSGRPRRAGAPRVSVSARLGRPAPTACSARRRGPPVRARNAHLVDRRRLSTPLSSPHFAPVGAYLVGDERGDGAPARRSRRRSVRSIRRLPARDGARLGGRRRRSGDWQAGAVARAGRAPRSAHAAARARGFAGRAARGAAPGDDSRNASASSDSRRCRRSTSTSSPRSTRSSSSTSSSLARRAPTGRHPSARDESSRARGGAPAPTSDATTPPRKAPAAGLARPRRARLPTGAGGAGRLRGRSGRSLPRARRASLLAALQADILDLRARGPASGEPPVLLRAGDARSPSCMPRPDARGRGAARSAAALFDRRSDARAARRVVMTPSIETYAPLIEAVFGEPRTGRAFPSHRRSPRARHRDVVDAFLRALDLPPAACRRPACSTCSRSPPCAQRFASRPRRSTRPGWVAEAGVRWGVDAAHRARRGQPTCGENTWRFGLDRLLLGYALPGATRVLAARCPTATSRAAGPSCSGSSPLSARRCPLSRASSRSPPPRRVARPLGELLAAALCRAGEGVPARRGASGAGAARRARGPGGFDRRRGLDAVRRLLASSSPSTGAALGFLAGGVTLCEMVPMRSVPFRVVCLLGMSDGVFPRAPRPLAST